MISLTDFLIALDPESVEPDSIVGGSTVVPVGGSTFGGVTEEEGQTFLGECFDVGLCSDVDVFCDCCVCLLLIQVIILLMTALVVRILPAR